MIPIILQADATRGPADASHSYVARASQVRTAKGQDRIRGFERAAVIVVGAFLQASASRAANPCYSKVEAFSKPPCGRSMMTTTIIL